MKKMAVLLLALAMAAGGAVPARALGAPIVITDTYLTFGKVEDIRINYASGTPLYDDVDLDTLSGTNITLYPRAGDAVTDASIYTSVFMPFYYKQGSSSRIEINVTGTFTLFPGETLFFYASSTSLAALLSITLSPTLTPVPPSANVGGGGGEGLLPALAKPGQEARIILRGGSAPVYDGPNPGANIIGHVPAGSTVHLLHWSGTMCRLLYNNDNNAGWVSGEYIEVVP